MEEKNINLEAEQPDAQLIALIERAVAEAVERSEARFAANLTDEQRADAGLNRREAALAERERMIRERELRAMAVEKLTERGLPRELADALPYGDEAKCLAGIETIEGAFRKAVQAGVDERLRGRAPVGDAGRSLNPEAMSDSEYYRLSAGKIL